MEKKNCRGRCARFSETGSLIFHSQRIWTIEADTQTQRIFSRWREDINTFFLFGNRSFFPRLIPPSTTNLFWSWCGFVETIAQKRDNVLCSYSTHTGIMEIFVSWSFYEGKCDIISWHQQYSHGHCFGLFYSNFGSIKPAYYKLAYA